MQACICMHAYACMTCVYMHACACKHAYACICMHACICLHANACMRMHRHALACVRMRPHSCTRMRAHACACALKCRTSAELQQTQTPDRRWMDYWPTLRERERERERGCTKHWQAQLKQPFCHDNVWKALAGTIKSAKIEEKVLIQDQSLAFKPYKCQRFQVVMCWKCTTIAGFKKKTRFWLICIDSELFRSFPLGFSLETVPGGPIVIHFHQILSSGMLFWMLF